MEMPIVPFLIIFPVIMACLMFVARAENVRRVLAFSGAVVIMAGSVVLAVQWFMNGSKLMTLYVETEVADHCILAAEILLMCVVTFLSFKYRKYWVCLLSIIPTCAMVWYELSGSKGLAPEDVMVRSDGIGLLSGVVGEYHIYIDRLSVLMCLIVGVIGGLIAIYAIGYMQGYHNHHKDVEDRSYYFMTILFLFLGAMFGFVLSESLLWIDFFWELTSVCSFLLIGYTREEEAIHNSFRALWMNLFGGCALAVGILYFALQYGTVSLHVLVAMGEAKEFGAATIAVALIAFAALTKAAQLPFSTWLIGAMVAPTPSSALLHSATMVKAGIYVLFRLSPAMHGTTTEAMIAFVGGFTFLATSLMAIAQSDGKTILAFSTISNLGLMVACAGVGHPETIWAGVFLMIFHAISKSLLFQDVGATENSLHSRDVEDMHGLIYILPRLGMFMFIGIAGMFLAPFGMLISKWSALRASVDERNIILVLFIVFGSATTSLYWTKWMGKLVSHTHLTEAKMNDVTKPTETLSLSVHAVLMVLLCMLFPLLSSIYVNPLIKEMFGKATGVLPDNILVVLVAIILLVFAVPIISFVYSRKMTFNRKGAYMNGVNTGDDRSFVDSFGERKTLWLSNHYYKDLVGSRKLMKPSQIFTVSVLIVMLVIIIGGAIV
ncbi:MAG: NADH-quinone oxidoreductase subunit L [Lachnospiraceae bacterium]|nr:NADH-quinone oxidoreductase subunit L [Lachnospiraceae bacterium]